ncbi:MAG: hypothetical protein SVU88_03420 [Candidatus Nanohaloarchaea archaeon]|nr:hypothetical protein [Candidatus Nanohaloarchaea archaeon]
MPDQDPDVLPLELEVLERKKIRVDDKKGSKDPNYKYKLDPSWDGWNPFWTNQLERDVFEPGDLLRLGRDVAQATLEEDGN